MDRIEKTLLRVDASVIETARGANTTAQGLNELREEVHRHFQEDKDNFKALRQKLEIP